MLYRRACGMCSSNPKVSERVLDPNVIYKHFPHEQITTSELQKWKDTLVYHTNNLHAYEYNISLYTRFLTYACQVLAVLPPFLLITDPCSQSE